MVKEINWTIVIVLGLIVGGLFLFGKQLKEAFFTQDTSIKVIKYDINGNPIRPVMSVVGGEQGVYYISFEIFAKNEGQSPYDFEIVSANPSELEAGIDYVKHVDILPGNDVKWTTDLIPTQGLESTSGDVKFSVTVLGTFECPSGYTCETDTGTVRAGEIGQQIKESSVLLKIEPDPLLQGSFNVGVTVTQTQGNFNGGQPGVTTTTIQTSSNVVAEGCQASLSAVCPSTSNGCQIRRLSSTGSCTIDRDIFKGNCAAGDNCVTPSSLAYYKIIMT